jgi:plastocyanin
MRKLSCIALLFLVACTNGGTLTPSGGGGGGTQTQTVDVNLTLNPSAQTSAGLAGGYSPLVTNVAVGTLLRFHNSDGFSHTATAIPNATTFPAGSPFSASAQTQSGTALSQGWSSGTLQAGAASQTILVDKAGTYLFGCFFHYGGPMRAVIVAH